MKRFWVLSLLLIPFLTVAAQESTPAGLEHWSAASLKQFGQTLNQEAATDPHHLAVKQLSDFPNELFLLGLREADGQVEWHETQVDVFVVQSGSATLLVGGTMVNGETVATPMSTTSILRSRSAEIRIKEMYSAVLFRPRAVRPMRETTSKALLFRPALRAIL